MDGRGGENAEGRRDFLIQAGTAVVTFGVGLAGATEAVNYYEKTRLDRAPQILAERLGLKKEVPVHIILGDHLPPQGSKMITGEVSWSISLNNRDRASLASMPKDSVWYGGFEELGADRLAQDIDRITGAKFIIATDGSISASKAELLAYEKGLPAEQASATIKAMGGGSLAFAVIEGLNRTQLLRLLVKPKSIETPPDVVRQPRKMGRRGFFRLSGGAIAAGVTAVAIKHSSQEQPQNVVADKSQLPEVLSELVSIMEKGEEVLARNKVMIVNINALSGLDLEQLPALDVFAGGGHKGIVGEIEKSPDVLAKELSGVMEEKLEKLMRLAVSRTWSDDEKAALLSYGVRGLGNLFAPLMVRENQETQLGNAPIFSKTSGQPTSDTVGKLWCQELAKFYERLDTKQLGFTDAQTAQAKTFFNNMIYETFCDYSGRTTTQINLQENYIIGGPLSGQTPDHKIKVMDWEVQFKKGFCTGFGASRGVSRGS